MTETTRKTQEEELNQAVNLWKNAVKAGKDTEQQKEQVWICFFDWCKDWDTIQDPFPDASSFLCLSPYRGCGGWQF